MAFPNVADVTTTATASGSSHLINMPATVNADDLLIVLIGLNSDATVTTPSGWTRKSTSQSQRGHVFVKKAVGNEDGTTVDFVTGNSQRAAALCYRVTSWSGALGDVEITTETTGTSSGPDSGSLTPSYGADETLWLSLVGTNEGRTVNAYPTGYSNGRAITSGSGGTAASGYGAERQQNTTTENPGAFTLSGSASWVAFTVAIRPVLLTTVTKTFSLDASLKSALSQPHSVDAVVRATTEHSHSVDAITRVISTKSHGTDADLRAAVERSFAVSASLLRASEKTHAVDASVAALVRHSVDATLHGTITKTHSVDANALALATKTFSVDARLRGDAGFTSYRHVFTPSGGGPSRTLPDPDTVFPRQLVDGFDGVGKGPGGFTDATGRISKDEYDAHPGIYTWGTVWRVYNDNDPGQDPFWAGTLTEPQEVGGVVTLQGQGRAKKADKFYDRLLWQAFDLAHWTTADSDPHDYDNDPQIDVKVHGNREIQFRIPKKSVFRRPTGQAKLDADAAAGDDKVELTNAWHLKRGDTITIGGISRTVKNTYNKGDTTVPLTATLGTAKSQGTAVTWSVPAGPDWWRTGIVGWFPTVNLKRIAFDIHKPDGKDSDYTLEVCTATGPDGALTVVSSTSMGSNTTSKDIALAGNPDLICIRLARSNEQKTSHAFRVRLRNVVVVGLANTAGEYTTEQVAGDIFDKLGGTKTVQASAVNAMPLDSEDASAGDVLDYLGFLEDRVWLALDDGTQTDWRYREWGGAGQNRVWRLVRPQFPVALYPVERFNRVIVPYRYAGGQKQTLKVVADPDPMAGPPYNDYRLDLDDPLPPKGVAQILGQIIANYLSQARWAGTARFTEVEDIAAPGVTRPATRVRPGDKVKLTYQGNQSHRVSEIHYTDAGVTVSFPDNHPLLDRLAVKRRLLLQRGRSQLQATIGGLGLRKPDQATLPGTPVTFRIKKKKHHHQDYEAVFDWNAVTTDVVGQPTYLKYYIAQLRYTDSGGTKIAGTDVIEHRIKDRDLTDNTDDLPTRFVFGDLQHPAGYYVQCRVKPVDVLHKEGAWTAWTSPLLPQAVLSSTPPAPMISRFVIHQHGADAEWDVGTDSDDGSADSTTHVKEADQRHHRFKYLLINPSGTVVRRSREFKGMHKHWKVEKPGTGTWTLKVWSVNSNGTESAVATATASRGDPATPASPSVSITQAGKLKLKATVSGTYDLNSYADDDIDAIRVQFIHNGNEREHTIKVPKDTTGTFSYSTVFHGVEAGDSTSSKAKVSAKHRQESAWSLVSSVTAGAGAQVAGGEIAPDSILSSHIGADEVKTTDLDDTGSLVALGTWKNASGATRVEINSGRVNDIDLYVSGKTSPGNIESGAGFIDIYPPHSLSLPYYASIQVNDSANIVLGSDEVFRNVLYTVPGWVGLQVPGGQVAAGETWGQGYSWAGATKLDSTPSSVTLTNVNADDNNVSSVSAADISTRGFLFKATASSGGVVLRALREYLA